MGNSISKPRVIQERKVRLGELACIDAAEPNSDKKRETRQGTADLYSLFALRDLNITEFVSLLVL